MVKETLRLYPVAPFQTRVLQQNTNLLGYEVPAGVSKHAEARNSSKTSTRLAADTALSQRNTVLSLLLVLTPSSSLRQMMVVMSVYTMGRDPAIFPNPDCFAPDRWLRDAPAPAPGPSATDPCPFSLGPAAPRPHSHAFFPFSIGSRSCIGRRLAENELYMLLARLVTRADLRVLNEVDMVIRMVGVTSQPLQVQVEPITQATLNTLR